jgi:signal transduction histidine kinase
MEVLGIATQWSHENPFPMMRVSADGILWYANPASAAVLQMWGSTVGGAVPAPIARLVEEVLASGKRRETEVECEGWVYAFWLVPALRRECVNVYATDITHRKRAEAELARSNADLEEFASMAAHDLRTPLMSIGGCATLIAERLEATSDPEVRQAIAAVQDQVRGMAGLIKTLLEHARAGSRTLNYEPCCCEAVLRRALRSLRPLLEESKAGVTWEPLPVVSADESLLAVLFQNLLENAIKYRAEDVPRIHISVRETDGCWEFSVVDNGVGISVEETHRIFAPYCQGLPKVAGRGGFGLGLATCNRIVNRHGGRIWAEPRPGGGTVFSFTLPKGSDPNLQILHPLR